MTPGISRLMAGTCLGTFVFLASATVQSRAGAAKGFVRGNPVLEWNQIFIDTLIATNTANSSSPRLGAIVHGQTSQTHSSITHARSDGNNARVWGGMHYPSTVSISSDVGSAIARQVDRTAMQRLHGKRD